MGAVHHRGSETESIDVRLTVQLISLLLADQLLQLTQKGTCQPAADTLLDVLHHRSDLVNHAAFRTTSLSHPALRSFSAVAFLPPHQPCTWHGLSPDRSALWFLDSGTSHQALFSLSSRIF